MTHNDLWISNLENDHGRNHHPQNIWKEDCRENTWAHKIKRMLENKNKEIMDKGKTW